MQATIRASTDLFAREVRRPARNTQTPPMTGGPAAPAFPIEHYSFEGLELDLHNMPEAAELLLLEGGSEERLGVTNKKESQRIALFDAFREKTANGQDMVVVCSGMGSNQRWDVFLRSEQGYSRSIDLSLRIQHAPNRDDARQGLQQP
ncbi:hypothetical protein [Azospirillum picis]|uniref:Uncharacterized protein n=1 Tax=Azospirillum picis TaxID=488438 RepID=A0ABU0MQ75_9PROT|nr:hypothetical protein [Azospirillum picis]MBP2302078.1 hypothetical protein [Azospirillum picis]MDQ0535631.1 hypothetical protein [Azospirillum picis]